MSLRVVLTNANAPVTRGVTGAFRLVGPVGVDFCLSTAL